MPIQTKNTITKDSIAVSKVDTSLIAKDTLHDSIPLQPLFENHLLAVKNKEPQLHTTTYDYWIASVLMLMYIFFVWIYFANRKNLNQIINGFAVGRSGGQVSRDEFSIGNRVAVILSIFFVITLTTFVSKALPYFGFHQFDNSTTVLALSTASIIIVIYSIKFFSIQFFGHIFKAQAEANEYSLLVFLFCNVLGLFMFPLIICLVFLKQFSPGIFIYSGLSIILVFTAIRLLRAIILGASNFKISKFYLFLYLCTLEILPFIILIKLFILKIK